MTLINKEDLIKSVEKKIWQAKENYMTMECVIKCLIDDGMSKEQACRICRNYSEMMVIAEGVNRRIQDLTTLIEGVE